MRWLLVKDLQILRRSPVLTGLLIVYPVAIALMIGVTFSSPPAKPVVAIADEVPASHSTIELGHQRLDITGYAAGLLSSVHALEVPTRSAALAAVRTGRALAAVVVPADLPAEVQSLITQGVGRPSIHVYLNTRDPIERRYVQQALASRIAGVQADISRRVLRLVVADLERVLSGGTVSLIGQHVHLLGLRDSRAIVDGTIVSLPRSSPLRVALRQVSSFASVAIAGLGFAKPVLGSIGTPLTVTETQLQGATTPTSAYAAAIAAVVSVMIVAMLLAAGALALERAESTYPRLVRGLVSRSTLVAEKVVLSAACAAVLMLVMSACVSAFVALDWSRFGLWAATAGLAALAFAALGVVIGALTREIAAASLAAFLLALPIAFVALVPGDAVSGPLRTILQIVAFCFPFRAALTAASSAFSATGPGPGLALAHLAVLALCFGALGRLGLRRFD